MTLLDRLSITIAPGAPTVLIGPNGAGKTTLLRAAMGLLAAEHGHGSAGSGRAAGAPSSSSGRRCCAGAPLPTCYALRCGRRRQARTRELLALVGLEHAADRPARRLSSGEQQRLALARALARDPAVLFLDEPTASLDPASTKAIEDVIRTVSPRGIKVVMSTHDLGEARRLAGEVVSVASWPDRRSRRRNRASSTRRGPTRRASSLPGSCWYDVPTSC